MTGPTQTPAPSPTAVRAVRLRAAIEGLVLVLVTLSPWAFAAVHPVSIFALYAGISAALVLWSVALVVERGPSGSVCPVLVCLAGMVVLGAWQLVPLPPSLLTTVAPASADLRAALLPTEPESVGDEPAPAVGAPTISFDPGATRRELVKLLAVTALFALVRYAVATPASFRRFAVVCVVNGAALSVFALAQRFSSGPNTIYWSFDALGSVFGPFVCKNHFPYYVNVCFGLGLGLLLGSRAFRARTTGAGDRLAELSRNPAALWLIAALGLMLAANLYSLSRGGVLAFVGAGVGCGVLAVVTGRRGGGAVAVVVVVGLGVGLVGWFGSGAVGKRLGTLSGGDALDDGRRDVWARTLPLALKFPVWGTGYGTFGSVEPQQRQPGDVGSLTWEHAHNDYLEALVEGGLVQLALAVAAVGFVFRAGVRAYRLASREPGAALVLGGLFGFTAVVLHSLADFGLHMPAIVVLVAVLAAHLTAAGEPAPAPGAARGWALLPVVGGCLLVAAMLPVDGWRRERAEHYRLAAIRAEKRLPAGEREPVVAYLRAAVAYAPDDAVLRLRLADVRYEEYLTLRARAPIASAAETDFLRPALRDYLAARALNPLTERPHARLAGARQHLAHPDPAPAYLDRATRLRPTDAGLWYLAGLAHLESGESARAWDCWRRSLLCSPNQLATVVGPALAALGPDGLVDRVLPPNPQLLVAACRLPVLVELPNERRVVLNRALELLPSGERADELYLRAWLLRETGHQGDAISAYDRALAKAPERVEWRYELAELCYATGDFQAAAEHVGRVLREQPNLAGARDLNAAIVRARAGKP